MRDVVVVSNRGPLSFRTGPDGQPQAVDAGGGLAATLRPLLAGTGATWVSASMGEADRAAAAQGLAVLDGLRLVSVPTDPDDYRMAYDVVSNATLWFCHHHLFDLTRRPRLDRHFTQAWAAYRRMNERFAQTVAEVAPQGAAVLVQDYHLCLVGRALARTRPDLSTVHFSHTPWGDPSALRTLPESVAAELLAGMAGFGACGFHTARWERALRAAYDDPGLNPGDELEAPVTFHSALGPDPVAITTEAAGPQVAAAAAALDAAHGSRQLIVRVDRIELSKNILRGIWAFQELLETRPEHRGRVTMLTLAYPSREGLADYLAYRSEIEHHVARCNERFATADWSPIVLDLADDRPRSVAALARADVVLVNAQHDGMNLVAKEAPLVSRRDAVLVLSRETGAAEELAGGAVMINPFDVAATAQALHTALTLAEPERTELAERLRHLVNQRTAGDWLADQLVAAGPAPAGAG